MYVEVESHADLIHRSHPRQILRSNITITGRSNMLFALSCDRMGVFRRLQHLHVGGRVAPCCWPHTADFHAPFIHGATRAEDSKSLSQRLSDRIGHIHRPRICGTTWSEPGQVL